MTLTWKQNLPLKPEHQLTDAAAAELLELLEGVVPVAMGTVLSYKDRAELKGDMEVIGAVIAAEAVPDNRVRVTVRMHEHDDAAKSALAGLKANTMELGLDMTVDKCEQPGDGGVVIGKVCTVRRVMVVPTGEKSRYTDADGTVHDGTRYRDGSVRE